MHLYMHLCAFVYAPMYTVYMQYVCLSRIEKCYYMSPCESIEIFSILVALPKIYEHCSSAHTDWGRCAA